MKRVAFAIVAVTGIMLGTGCSCLPKISCCWAGVLTDLLALLGVLAPTA